MSRVCIVLVCFVFEHPTEEAHNKALEMLAAFSADTISESLDKMNLAENMSRTTQEMFIYDRTGNGKDKDDDFVVSVSIDMVRDETKVSPATVFQRIADKYGCTYVYSAEDNDEPFYVNTDITGTYIDDRYMISGTGFGLDEHANIEYFDSPAALILWFQTHVNPELHDLDQCMQMPAKINAEGVNALTIYTFKKSWELG